MNYYLQSLNHHVGESVQDDIAVIDATCDMRFAQGIGWHISLD